MELDDAYANAAHIPGADAFPPKWAEAARAFRDLEQIAGRARLNLPYGETDRQRLDLFYPAGRPRGLVVFVHGGYWLRFDRSFWSHLARGAQAQGWAVAMPSYDLCPEVRIADITAQIARAVETAAATIPGPLRLVGHSAGGHLVARMLEPGLLSEATAARLARVVPVSPVSDLRPLLRTSMNEQFGMDETAAATESPALMPARLPVPVTVWVGAEERPVFLDQARWLADAWACDRVVRDGEHHFTVIEPLEEADSALTRAVLS